MALGTSWDILLVQVPMRLVCNLVLKQYWQFQMEEQQSSGKTLNYCGKTMAGFHHIKSQTPVLFPVLRTWPVWKFSGFSGLSPNLSPLALLLEGSACCGFVVGDLFSYSSQGFTHTPLGWTPLKFLIQLKGGSVRCFKVPGPNNKRINYL